MTSATQTELPQTLERVAAIFEQIHTSEREHLRRLAQLKTTETR